MANTFKNQFASAIGVTPVAVYTNPALTQATVIGMSIANLLAVPISVSVYVTSAATNYYMIKNATIAPGGALVPVGGDQKLVLEAGDRLQVQMGTATSADVIVSVLEVS
jgi:hypothetical protein